MGCHTWFFRPIKDGEKPKDTCDYSIDKFGENLYTDIDTPKDVFRIGGFPEDFLLSLNQTLEFIEQHKSEISFSNNWLEDLEIFWRENPKGVIEFG